MRVVILKILKVREQEQSKPSPRSTSFSASPHHHLSNSSNRCVIGSYRANIDPERPNQRVYSAIVPKDYYEQVREANIDRIQLSRIEQNFSDIHQTVSNVFSAQTPGGSTQQSLNFSTSFSDAPTNGNTKISIFLFLFGCFKLIFLSIKIY